MPPGALLLERLSADPTPRPLLACPDPAARLAELLQERRPLYAQADLHILQDGRPPAEVAQQVIRALPAILRQRPAAPTEPVALVDSDGAIASSLN
jgi:shikimate kinase